MRTINSFLKEARLAKGFSIDSVEKETRIKKSFIVAIEQGNWKVLPEFPVVVGFVKNIAEFLEIDRTHAVALLKRDYPPQKTTLSPKPDLAEGFHWGPRMTFLVGVALILITVFSYLFFQYRDFTKNPTLIVDQPKEAAEITQSPIVVSGKTDPEVTLRVNNQPVIIGDDGTFVTELPITAETTEIKIRARSRGGKETETIRSIKPRLSE